jgi:hypothetical protein
VRAFGSHSLAATTAATATNALALGGLPPSAYAPATPSAVYLAKPGDTMAGPPNLPANGLVAGADQLLLSGGKVFHLRGACGICHQVPIAVE